MAAATTTITIPDDLREALEAFGRREGLPEDLTSLVEAYLQHRLGPGAGTISWPTGPFPIPVFEEGSGRSDVSVNHDRYLAEDTYRRKLGGSR